MFESWTDIRKKFEVFLFMCGIMEDPSPAINHMCKQYATEYPHGYPELHHLLKITTEIRNKQKFLNPFCNDHIYFVWQLPLKQQSRIYIFYENRDWLEIGNHGGTTHMALETNTDISSCRVLISNPYLPTRDILQAITTLRQTITYLKIDDPFVLRDEACDNIPSYIFKIDPSATHIHIEEGVVLPKAIGKDLGRELSTCYNLSELWIPNQPFIAAGNTCLSRNKQKSKDTSRGRLLFI